MAYVRGARRSSLVKIIVVPEEPKPQRAAPKPKPVEAGSKKTAFDPSKCGERRGYLQHKRFSQEPCDACKAASVVYYKARWAAQKAARKPKPVGVYDPAVCGTTSGYNRHNRHRTTQCLPCRAAKTEYDRTRHAGRKAAA